MYIVLNARHAQGPGLYVVLVSLQMNLYSAHIVKLSVQNLKELRMISHRRHRELNTIENKNIVMFLNQEACQQRNTHIVDDLTRLWDLRCSLAMRGLLPWGSTGFTNLEEMLYIAKNFCNL